MTVHLNGYEELNSYEVFQRLALNIVANILTSDKLVIFGEVFATIILKNDFQSHQCQNVYFAPKWRMVLNFAIFDEKVIVQIVNHFYRNSQ